ncbi:MAG: peptidylprolyl isomerase [Oscillospiraceae bacterium]|nr:peptidylprolyl isomerase [Oscillospiraceae bacterium]
MTITIGNLGTFRGGTITAELYPDKAPNTVNNFISLVKSGYFTGRVFHRAAPGFMIQGGSPNGDGLSTGFPYAIPGEFANAGFAQNDLKHTPGVLSMARMGAPYGQDPTPFYHTASCQFFIMHANYPSLDGDYAAFGKVTSGMDIVDRVANQPADGNMILLEKPVITGMTVETFGLDYPAPETVAAP